MGFSMMFIVPLVVIVAFAVITATVKILRQYERAVVFTLGRFQGVKGPGLVLLLPLLFAIASRATGTSLYWFSIESIFCAQFVLLAVWLATSATSF